LPPKQPPFPVRLSLQTQRHLLRCARQIGTSITGIGVITIIGVTGIGTATIGVTGTIGIVGNGKYAGAAFRGRPLAPLFVAAIFHLTGTG